VRAIDIPDSHRDLLDGQVAVLATIGADGCPQVTALWFLYTDEDGLRLSLNTVRQKTRNLTANENATLFFIDAANPYRTLEIRGTASIEPDGDHAFADRLGSKYGTDLRTIDQPGETRVVVTLRPTRVNTYG
jgi:PPOX class probable F420-dependent enzyme